MKYEAPTLVVAAYNRLEPLKRILNSVSNAKYPGKRTNLVISIDNDYGESKNVAQYAKEFKWEHGNKEVILHAENLGIRNHFNFCGDLTEKYGCVVFLEDDLYVSVDYYSYVLQALEKFGDHPKIAGISLFNYQRIERWNNPFPFTAIDDGSDNYFLQQASWGQIWTWEMWQPFQRWYKQNNKPEIINSIKELPLTIKGWPPKSWKKFYIAYMIMHNKYYVFPRISLCSNFDDPGTNRKSKTVHYQSPMLLKDKKFNFRSFDESLSVYDSYFELLPEKLKILNPSLKEFDFEVDLYGSKNLENIDKEWILSTFPGNKIMQQYALKMKPHELNIIYNIEGNGIYLTSKQGIKRDLHKLEMDFFVYYYRNIFRLKELWQVLKYKYV
jgi:hypothetical protein